MRILSRPVLAGTVASGLAGYLLTIFMAYLGPFLDNLGTGALIVGIIFLSRNFIQIFIRIPLAELSQMIGRKPLITSGILFYTIAFSLMWISTTWITVLLATIILSIGMACYWPAMFAYIGDITTDDFGKINGIIFQGSDIGIIVGTLFTTLLLDKGLITLRNLFGYSIIIGLIGTIVVFLFMKEVIKEKDKVPMTNLMRALMGSFLRIWTSLVKMTRISPLGLIYSLQFVIAFTEFFFSSFFSLFIIKSKGYSEADVSLVLLISTIIVLFFKPYLGSISDKFGFKNPALIGLFFNSIIIYCFTIVNSLIGITILYILLTASSLTTYLAVNGATSYSSPSHLRGLAMGALGTYVSLGRSFSSTIITPIWSIFENKYGDRGESLISVFQLTSILIVVLTFLLYLVGRTTKLENFLKERNLG